MDELWEKYLGRLVNVTRSFVFPNKHLRDFPGGSDSEIIYLPMEETWAQSLGSGRSPGGENGNPLQYSCVENSMDRGAWRAKVHGLANSQAQLSN